MSTPRTPNPSTPTRILIVDDERDILDLLSSCFADKNATVVTAENGLRALQMSESDNYDAIITDFKMPQMNGLDLIKHIRTGKLNRKTPIFLVTGNADSDSIRKIATFGVANIIMKPFSSNDIATKIIAKIIAPPKAQVTYDVNFINCCTHAAQDVLEFYLGSSPTIGKPSIKTDTLTHGFASGLISICHKSEILGSFSLTVDKLFVANLGKSIFGEGGPALDDAMIADMTGEMCNQLVGKLKIHLAKESYYISIGLPEMVVGENHRIAHKSKNPVLCIPIKCADSNATIEICLTGAIEKGEPPQGASESIDSGYLVF